MKRMKRRLLSAFTALILAAGCFILPCSAGTMVTETRFEDVTIYDSCASYVEYVAERGYFVGTSATTFEPDKIINRGEYVTVLAAMYQKLTGETLTETTDAFSDVSQGDWYAVAVNWACENGITAGYPDGTFRPQGKMTVEMEAIFANRFLELLGVEPSQEFRWGAASPASDWAAADVEYACSVGLFTHSVYPKTEVTRAGAAELITHLDEAIRYPTLPNPADYAIHIYYDSDTDLEMEHTSTESPGKGWTILEDYETYLALVEQVQGLAVVDSEVYPQRTDAVYTPLEESAFEEYNVLAILRASTSDHLYYPQLSSWTAEGDTCQVQLISYAKAYTGSGAGAVFFLPVPKTVSNVEVQEAHHVSDNDWFVN